MRYLKPCSSCKKNTLHKVVMLNLKLGVKLQCLECGHKNPYCKLNKIINFGFKDE